MSNYPPSLKNFKRTVEVTVICEEGHRWQMLMARELGGWFIEGDDGCPYCGKRGLPVMEAPSEWREQE